MGYKFNFLQLFSLLKKNCKEKKFQNFKILENFHKFLLTIHKNKQLYFYRDGLEIGMEDMGAKLEQLDGELKTYLEEQDRM